jgi:hypothetical protein
MIQEKSNIMLVKTFQIEDIKDISILYCNVYLLTDNKLKLLVSL